jgi:hypothetical protein
MNTKITIGALFFDVSIELRLFVYLGNEQVVFQVHYQMPKNIHWLNNTLAY